MSSMSVEIVKVQNRSQLRKFIMFPYELYKNCAEWVPALIGDEFDTFNPKKNAAFDFCKAECYLAYRNGKIVGRTTAIINESANKIGAQNNVRFGWTDFVQDQEVVNALLGAVAKYGKSNGCTTMVGPWGFTDMDKEGALIEGFDILSPFTCLYNYPYYDEMYKATGLEKDVDWIQKSVSLASELPQIYQFADDIEKRYGIHIAQAKNMRELCRRYGQKVFHVYNEAFAPLHNFSPLTDRQINDYLDTYIPILDVRFTAVCVDENDEPVGFTFCVPTLSRAVKKSGGRLFPFGVFRIMHALKHNNVLEALLIGIKPEYQSKGAALLMLKHIHENCKKAGVTTILMNPQLEENLKVQTLFDIFDQKVIQRRRAYKRNL